MRLTCISRWDMEQARCRFYKSLFHKSLSGVWGEAKNPPLKSLLQILQLFRFNKLWRIRAIGLFSLTLLLSLFLSLQGPGTPAAQKPRILAFTALQMRGSEARNNLFAVNANSWARRELAPHIDVSPTLVWSPNGQRLAFVSGDTDIYTINADGSRLTKQFAGDACKAANFEIAWFSNSQKLLLPVLATVLPLMLPAVNHFIQATLRALKALN